MWKDERKERHTFSLERDNAALRSPREVCTTQDSQPNTPELETQFKQGFSLFTDEE
jgi:hypothetical protein